MTKSAPVSHLRCALFKPSNKAGESISDRCLNVSRLHVLQCIFCSLSKPLEQMDKESTQSQYQLRAGINATFDGCQKTDAGLLQDSWVAA